MTIQEKIYRYFEQYPDLHVLFLFDPNNVHSMEYHDRLHSVADQQIDFDLDDGVVVNYAKFGDVLAKIK